MSGFKIKYLAVPLLSLSAFTALASDPMLMQAGLLSAAENGFVIGDYTYKKLKKQGDFGLGTFNDLDGEMVAIDGDFYQYWPGGKTKSVDSDLMTPFAQVTHFKSKVDFRQKNEVDYKGLKAKLTPHIDNRNIPYAIRIDGKFKMLVLNSRFPVSEGNKDPAARVYKVEKEVEGTLIGYWFPKDLISLTSPGFHFHFISDDRKLGGHVIALTMKKGKVHIMPIYQVQLALPQGKLSKQHELGAPTETGYKPDAL